MLDLLYIIGAYFIGAIPFGYIAGKMNGIDLREHGSHNIGATNAVRVLGKKWGLGVLVCDVLKGFLPVLGVQLWQHPNLALGSTDWMGATLLVATFLAVVIGHSYTCFLGFKGGKGVATTGGGIFALAWPIAAICLVLFLIIVWRTRYVSLGSILSGVFMTITALWYFDYFGADGWALRPSILVIALYALVAVLIFVKHKANIIRLMNGTESKSFTKKENDHTHTS